METILMNLMSRQVFVLLQIQEINCKRKDGRLDSVNVLWGSGSTLSFITFRKAQSLKLKGKKSVKMQITKVGGNMEEIVTTMFHLTMLDKLNKEVYVTVFCMDKISNNITTIEIQEVLHFFPRIQLKDFNRPEKGEIECPI